MAFSLPSPPAVVGRPHDIKGQGIVAFVTLKGGIKASAKIETEPARVNAAAPRKENFRPGKLIYVIDDDTALAEYLATQLRERGFQTRTFDAPNLFLEELARESFETCLIGVRAAARREDEANQESGNEARHGGLKLPQLIRSR